MAAEPEQPTSATRPTSDRAAAPRAPWLRAVHAVLLCLVVLNAWANLRFVIESGEAATYEGRMTIDAPTYVDNAREMVAAGHWLYTPDFFHSAAMSAYVAALFRLFDDSLLAVKLCNVALWAGTLGMLFFLVRRVGLGTTFGYVAVFLCSASETLQKYCALVQYEVPVMFLLTLFALLAANPAKRVRTWVAMGMIVGALCTFRAHFVALLALYAVAGIVSLVRARQARSRAQLARVVGAALVGYAAVALPWIALYSASTGELVFFQSTRGFLGLLNPAAQGAMWPFPEPTEPSGIEFVLTRPHLYLRLLGLRFLYLFGFVPDVWHVPSRLAGIVQNLTGVSYRTAQAVFASGYVGLAAGGVAQVAAAVRRGGAQPGLVACAVCTATVLAPQLVVGSSTRYLAPIMPALLCLQVAATAALVERLERSRVLLPSADARRSDSARGAVASAWTGPLRRWLARRGARRLAAAVAVVLAATVAWCAVGAVPAPAEVELDVGTKAARVHLAHGFSTDETISDRSAVWSDAAQAQVHVDLDPRDTPYQLELEGAAFWSLAPLTVTVRVNGQYAGRLTFPDGFARRQLLLPPKLLVRGRNVLLLEFGATARPAAIDRGSQDERDVALLLDRLRLAPSPP